jgi:hypothetical protein
LRTGRVLLAGTGEIVIDLLAYMARVVSLPVVAVFDVVSSPILRWLDRGNETWWVIEVRFHGWDAEFLRIVEAGSRAEAEALRRLVNAAD